MCISFNKTLGTVEWFFCRKAYRKARWRKVGSRMLEKMMADERFQSGLIVIV